jgi:FMN-dependent NADH-azoreductase
MIFLRVDASIRHRGSVSRELTDTVLRAWRAANPDGEIVHRDLGMTPAGPQLWARATMAGFVPEDLRTPAMVEARAAATQAADEVLAADLIAVGAPLYNFGVPAAVKAWLDLLITDPRFDPRHTPIGRALSGVPVCLAVASGGGYGPGTPRAGWDHGTPYLQRIFGEVFGAEVVVIRAELTAVETDPALAALRPQAERSRAEALALAATTGARLAASTGRVVSAQPR